MFDINNNLKVYALLFVVILATSVLSIAYLTRVAENSGTENAKAYPAPLTSTAHDNVVLATNMVENRVFSMDKTAPFEPTSWRVPGYPVLAASFYIVFNSFYPLLFVQLLALFLTVILIFKMSVRLMDRRWALALSILYLLLPDTILAASALTTENIFTFIFVVALYVFFFSDIKNIYWKWGLTGFLIALATYVREASFYIFLFFIPAYFIFYIKRSEVTKKHILAVVMLLVVFMATLLPWFVRNKKTFGVFAFASTSGNVLLRQNAAQFYQTISGLNAIESRNALLERAGFPKGSVPDDFKSSGALKKVAFDVIMEHPFRYGLFHLSTFIPFFTSSGAQEYWRFTNDMLPDFNPAPEPSLIQALHPFSMSTLIIVIKNHGWTLVENFFWAVISLFVFLSIRYSRDVRLTRMFLAIIFYFALVTGPIAHARYRIPVEPLILICAFCSAAVIWNRYRDTFFKKLT